jgi:hypothetical protein
LALRLASNSHLAILFPSTIFSLQQFFSLPKASHTKKPYPSKSQKQKATKQRQKPQNKSLVSSFSEYFITSGKQDGAAILGEGHDIVIGETSDKETQRKIKAGKRTKDE